MKGFSQHQGVSPMKATEKSPNPKAKTYNESFDAMNEVAWSSVPDDKGKVTDKSEAKYDSHGNYYTTSKDDKAVDTGRKKFTKAAEDWNMKTYGTKNPTSVANKGGMTKKELAAKHKAGKTTPKVEKTPKVEPKVAAVVKPTKTEKVVTKGEVKKTKISNKAAKKTGEVVENVNKKSAKISRKNAKKEFGKGSKEHLAAKDAHLKAKESDRQGGKGGKKQGIFGKLSSKINAKRQVKNKGKLKAVKNTDHNTVDPSKSDADKLEGTIKHRNAQGKVVTKVKSKKTGEFSGRNVYNKTTARDDRGRKTSTTTSKLTKDGKIKTTTRNKKGTLLGRILKGTNKKVVTRK